MSGSTSLASRVIMAISSVLALFALGLPFALESGSTSRFLGERVFGGTETWPGWSLARKSHIDGHLPIPLAAATILVVATACLVVLAWLALERPTTWMLAASALIGVALLIGSVVIGNEVQGNFGDGHQGATGSGLGVFRVALLLVVVAAMRAAVQSERDTGTAWRT
jgi:hypothetical protein